eukprot:1154239-Pelagomonas_calceolata.AAC.8
MDSSFSSANLPGMLGKPSTGPDRSASPKARTKQCTHARRKEEELHTAALPQAKPPASGSQLLHSPDALKCVWWFVYADLQAGMITDIHTPVHSICIGPPASMPAYPTLPPKIRGQMACKAGMLEKDRLKHNNKKARQPKPYLHHPSWYKAQARPKHG